MSNAAALRESPQRVRACTICADLPRFGLLAEEMEAILGAEWGNLAPAEAAEWLAGAQAEALDFAALVLGREDEAALDAALGVVRQAAAAGVPLLVVARDLGATALHRLLADGAQGFVPYPLPEGALAHAVSGLRVPDAAAGPAPARTQPKVSRDGLILPVQGMGGGLGATTFAVNLAWELETIDRKSPPLVCLIDLDLQFGSVATYLDLPRRETVFELLSNTEAMEWESFRSTLQPFMNSLHVLTANADMLPLDFIGPDDVSRLLRMAQRNFDYVVVDMPSAVTPWTETVLNAAHVYFALLELDLRSAQNTQRMIRALAADQLPQDKLRFILNRAPGATDFSGRSRVRRLAETLDIALDVRLPDGGRRAAEAADAGRPLALAARRNPLRREIRKLARSLHDLNRSVTQAG